MLERVLQGIKPLNKDIMAEAKDRIDFLAKPVGSLGRLEDIAIRVAGITEKVYNELPKKCTIVMSADNGIWDEGIASTPQHVTAVQTVSMLKGIAGISVLSKQAGANLRVVDIGIKGSINHPKLINQKVRYGTGNFALELAMSKEEVIQAIEVGINQVKELVDEGYSLLGTGEMGIGNTTTSAAILMAFSGMDAEIAVGRGAGLTDEAFEKKKQVITDAIKMHNPDCNCGIDVLSKVGGLDIAGLVGCFLGAAYYRVPIVIDGVISAAAAFTAYKMMPVVKEYMIPSHKSTEPAYVAIMKEMDLYPILEMNMRLGEGTGCPLAFHIVDSAIAMTNHMGTFDDISLNTDYLEGLEHNA